MKSPRVGQVPESHPIKSKHVIVTPAEAGVQGHRSSLALGSRFRGNDDFISSDKAPVGGDLLDIDEVRVAPAAIAPADGAGVWPITLTAGDGAAPVGRPAIFKVTDYS
jgi:hypothetical protein